jgi:hypothetical protein
MSLPSMTEQPMSAPGSRLQSWRKLLESGFDPRLYSWVDLPVGIRRVELEEHAWHRRLNAVVCFFRDVESEQRYRVTVFEEPGIRRFGPEGVDFRTLPPQTILNIEIQMNRTGTFRIVGAQL